MSNVSAHLEDPDTKEKDVVAHFEYAQEHVTHEENLAYLNEAILAEEQEHMGVIEALKRYPQATFWSFMVSFCIIMEAYDNALIGNFMAQPAFQKHFGVPVGDGTYQVETPWQGALNNASTIGAFIGILICGYIQPKLGYKKTILGSLVAMVALIFIPFFAETLPVLLVGQLLCGLPWGFYNALAQAYGSEIAPLPLRGLFTMYNQSCWCTGQFITAGILYSFRNGTTKWAYKIPFAIQWVWPVPLIAILAFAPESPWWLVRNGKIEEAEKTIMRLEGKSKRDPTHVIAMIKRTIEIEQKEVEGASYREIFKGVHLQRTIVACFMFAAQNWSGLLVGNNATYFFTVAGMDPDNAFALSLGNTAIQWIAVTAAFWAITRIGRRTLYLWGVGFQATMLILIGIVSVASKSSTAFWIQATLLILVFASYGFTIGPVTFSIVAEVSSVKLRAQTCAMARAGYYAAAVGSNYISSYSLNPLAWDLKGKAAFIWFGTAIMVFVFTFFLVPETKDRSYRELDVLYHRGISPRKFKTTVVEKNEDE
ncbi:hypothetical protein I316_04434 [Kwoniella heveanensis BCC8398]|uniref:Major facilitator superfamily (MFS) profile domain-containing protein n=1 Tax=Kwoniella heveanensis BCC8398 TaxID=1296120 RepID=A0A1B9GRN9_9TREE|nr:hypothetical protein I316_04434 [Kwoniella heveanensis BCC8398]